ALVGGLRVLGANSPSSDTGVFTSRRGTPSNDFFVNLLDMGTVWTAVAGQDDAYPEAFEGRDRQTGAVRWRASRVDLVFGSNAHLRAIAEVYGSADGGEQFVSDFVAAWSKVMALGR
ncbi:MAG: catalase-peroxidase, partial [Duganella sp.]